MMHVRRVIKAVHGCMTLLNKQYYDLDAYVTGKSEHRTYILFTLNSLYDLCFQL